LQVIGAVGRTKQFSVRIQGIEDFDRTDAATGEEIRLSRNEVFAAGQIKIGAENACGRGRSSIRLRTEQRQDKRESKTRRGHLNPSGSSRHHSSKHTVTRAARRTPQYIAACTVIFSTTLED
jgi:hypothetical protein